MISYLYLLIYLFYLKNHSTIPPLPFIKNDSSQWHKRVSHKNLTITIRTNRNSVKKILKFQTTR